MHIVFRSASHLLAVTGSSRQADTKPVITRSDEGKRQEPASCGIISARNLRRCRQTPSFSQRQADPERRAARPEHRKRRGRTSPAADLEPNWLPAEKTCPKAWPPSPSLPISLAPG